MPEPQKVVQGRRACAGLENPTGARDQVPFTSQLMQSNIIIRMTHGKRQAAKEGQC